MDEPLFSIGRFARVADLPPSALRHYDEVGLLPAAHVDPVTAYRYYDRRQQETARLLARLRELDVPIEEMRRLVALSGRALAEALEELAADQLQRTQRRVAALRQLAGQVAEDPRRATRIFLDPAMLADALHRISPICGDAPFDAILLLAGSDGVRFYASDRYRLAALHCPTARGAAGRDGSRSGAGAPVRALIARAGLDRVFALLDQHADEVSLEIDEGGMRIAHTALESPSDDAFPDLVSIDAELTAEPRVRRVLDRSVFDGASDELVIAVGDTTVHLTGALACEAVGTLVAGPVLVEATSEARPVVLSSPARPRHHVVVMPRKH